MRVGVVQTNTGRDVASNLVQLDNLLSGIGNVDLVVTPECTNLMGYRPDGDILFHVENDPTVAYLKSWAKDNWTNVVIGSVLVDNLERGGAVNRQLLIDSNGEVMTHYDKIHMFDVDLPNGESFRESTRFMAGTRAVASDIQGVKFGHGICFDLRFPALFNALAEAGAQVLLVPAAFTQMTGRAHWESLLRARAIETGSFVIAPGQCGSFTHHDGSTRHCWGHSMVVSPWGEVLAELGDIPDVAVVDIDTSAVTHARTQIPVIGRKIGFDLP